MDVALTVMTRANCWGALVGAVLVLDNRIISTGFNGTPQGFANCRDGGCERCRQRELYERGDFEHITEPELAHGPKQLDLCLCVHAEANALLSAAKCGTRTDGSSLYATSQPCFACLKEAHQAGVTRIVFLERWSATDSQLLLAQYDELAEHLSANNPRHFEQLARQADAVRGGEAIVREPNLDSKIDEAHQRYEQHLAKASEAAEEKPPQPARQRRSAAKAAEETTSVRAEKA
jgi:dCMP deaminase